MYSSYSMSTAVCSVIFPVLATTAVALRFRARAIKSAKYGVDDYLVLASLVFAVALCCLILYGSINASFGQDLRTITPEEYTEFAKILYVIVIVALIAYGLVKISVLELYKRIFGVYNISRFRLYANVMIVIVVGWTVSSIIAQVFSSWPIERYWAFGGTSSIGYGTFLTVNNALDLTLDLVILCFPIPMIKKLNMDRRRKIMLAGVFWLGFFCIVAIAVRLYFAHEFLGAGSVVPHVSNEWFSYVSVNNVIWAEIESCCSIVAACLPCLGPLVSGVKGPGSWGRRLASLTPGKKSSMSSNSESLLELPPYEPASSHKTRLDVEVPGRHDRWYGGLINTDNQLRIEDTELGTARNFSRNQVKEVV